jgi:hypothetical protein
MWMKLALPYRNSFLRSQPMLAFLRMVVYIIKRNGVPRMPYMQKQDRQGSPGRESMSRMPGKNQETKELMLDEKPRQKPKRTP